MKYVVLISLWCCAAFGFQGPSAFFDTDQDKIINLDEVLAFAARVDGAHVILHCYADSRGSVEHNEALAAKRCASVAELFPGATQVVIGELAQKVVEAGRIDDRYGRMQLNRVVDIYFELRMPTLVAPKRLKNNISLAAGYAPNDLRTDQVGPNAFDVHLDYDIIFGVSYTRDITRRITLGFDIYSNKSAFGKIGLNF